MSDQPAPGRTGPQGRPSAVVLTAVLFVAMLISTLPEFALGVLAPFLTTDLGIGEASVGFAASAMYVTAAVVARAAGRVMDVVERRAAVLTLFLTASASLGLLAASRDVVWLAVVGLVGGIGLGINNPITSRLIVELVPAGRRGLVIGVKQTGVKVGQSLAGAVLPVVALGVGWRTGLVGAAVAGLGLAVAAWLLVPGGVRPGPVPSGSTGPAAAAPALRRVRWLQVYSFAMATSQSALTIYLALYAVRLGASATTGGLLVTAFAVTATVTRLVWVTAADRLMTPRHALVALAAGAAVGLAPLLVVAHVTGPGLLWASAILTGASIGTWNVVVQLAILDEVEPGQAASATGAVQAIFMLGLAAGAPAFGVLVEATGTFRIGWAATVTLCLVALVTALRHPTPPHVPASG